MSDSIALHIDDVALDAHVRTDPTPVPFPIETRIIRVVKKGQEISGEQRERVAAWLWANGVEPRKVAMHDITIEYKAHGDREWAHLICFSEYYENEDGHREIDLRTENEALTYQRSVVQKVPLDPDPILPGVLAQMEADRARNRGADD